MQENTIKQVKELNKVVQELVLATVIRQQRRSRDA